MKNRYAFLCIVIIISFCTYLGSEAFRIKRLVDAGANMSRNAQKFETSGTDNKNILILGDSLAFGVGASSTVNSFAGVLSAEFQGRTIKNNAVIGETISSLDKKLDLLMSSDYEEVYIIVGGNDIMRLHINIFNSRIALDSLIEKVAKRANKVYLVTTGEFKYVSLAPTLLRGLFDKRASMLRDRAIQLESRFSNFEYVDFYSVSFTGQEYKQLEAPDGYHLNDAGIQKLVSVLLSDKY